MINQETTNSWLERTTRTLLVFGTWISFTLILLGGLGIIYQYGDRVIQPETANIHFGLLPDNNIFASAPHSLIELGLLLLVVVQVLRVALLFFYYVQLKDRWFILISGFILVSLLYSLLWNYI